MELIRREKWIDGAKAIGIILVLIGHCNISNTTQAIYLFHMPLFFILSGFCWNNKKNKKYEIKEFVRKKAKAYLLPYIKICLICLLILGIPEGIHNMGLGSDFWNSQFKYLWGIFIYSRGTSEWLPFCSPVWFLTSLFCAEVVFFFIMKQRYSIIGIIIAGLLGVIMSIMGKMFPWNIDSALTAVPLIYTGVILKKSFEKISNWYLLLLIPVTVVLLFFGTIKVDFDGNQYDNVLLMYVEATIIVLTILKLCHISGGGICYQSLEKKHS